MRKILTVLVAGALGATVWAAPAAPAIKGTVHTDAGSNTGTIRWSARDKSYVIGVQKGGMQVEVQVKAADVTGLDIAKPAGIDRAIQQVESGNGASAVAALKQVVATYSHLYWDKVAGCYLAKAYLDKDPASALKTCEDIIAGDATAGYKGDLAPVYWEALIANNRKGKLDEMLKKAASSGDRAASGAALIKRGNFIVKDGNESNDACRKALTDGYLRVVLLYTEADVAPKVQPEALYQAAKCFEKLGQTSRAQQLRQELKGRYAASPWASK